MSTGPSDVNSAEKRFDFFREQLLDWFSKNGRDFPWREDGLGCYESVISEILLRKTHAQTVKRMYEDFLKEFPSWAAIADSETDKLEHALWGIGLWRQRAKSMKKLAAEMIDRKGVFPRERKALEKLPSVGKYVANSILLLCHEEPSPLVDWNTARVIKRFFFGLNPDSLWDDSELIEKSKNTVKTKQSKELNWAMIDLGTLICRRTSPLHEDCPLSKECLFVKH